MPDRPDPRSTGRSSRATRTIVAVALVLLAWRAAPALAADAPAPSGRRALVEIGLPKAVPTALDSVPHPWPGRALLLSTAGAALPFMLMTGADHEDSEARAVAVAALEVLTPSAGYFYGGLPRRALIGIGVRAAGFAMSAKALSADTGEFDWNVVLALAGLAVIGLSAVVDVVTVSSDVDRANRERFASPVSLGVRVTPSGHAPALALIVRL